jgi:hypothetical protein
MQPSPSDRAASPAGLMRPAYYPDSSVSTDWTAAFLTDLLVPLSNVQAAERDLWTLWGRAAEEAERCVLDLTVDLSDGCETLTTPTLRDTSQRAYAELKKHLSGTAWEAALKEFTAAPDVGGARWFLSRALRRATPELFSAVPYWSIVLRLVDATTATVEIEGTDVVYRNLRGRAPSPQANSARWLARAEPWWQLLECHSLSVQPWTATTAHLAYNVRALRTSVTSRDFDLVPNIEVALRRHVSSRGSQSTEGNRFRLPSVVIDQYAAAADRTFCEGFHGRAYIMDTEARLEPLMTLP